MVIRIQLLYYNNHSKLLEFESSNQLAGILLLWFRRYTVPSFTRLSWIERMDTEYFRRAIF